MVLYLPMAKKRKIKTFIIVSLFLIMGSIGIWLGVDYTWIPPAPPVIRDQPLAIQRHPSNTYTWGIDISHHQGLSEHFMSRATASDFMKCAG
jgi:hypothetical protein